MWHDLFPLHFTDAELHRLNSLEGKTLTRVMYTVWHNIAQKGNDYQALDWVELIFDDGESVALTAGEHSDGLRITDFNFGLEQTKIQQQFNGQVMLDRSDVSTGQVWSPAIGNKLTSVGLLEGPDEKIQNNQLQFDFAGEKMLFELNEEGMVVRQD